MPQMAPLNWTCLFLMFLISFIILLSMNYFLIQFKFSKIPTSQSPPSNSFMTWKW